MDNVLVLVRHGQSEWNERNLFTGWRDPDLTKLGVQEAEKAGKLLKAHGIKFDIAYTSVLLRAKRTLSIIMENLNQTQIPVTCNLALNERDYGELSGLNKDEARNQWGEEQVLMWRRSYDIPPPGGESLKDTAARVLPYYKKQIWPAVKSGKNVIVAAHDHVSGRAFRPTDHRTGSGDGRSDGLPPNDARSRRGLPQPRGLTGGSPAWAQAQGLMYV